MPKPKCIQCGGDYSLLWRNEDSGQICNECYDKKKVEADAQQGEAEAAGGTRKSTRSTRAKPRGSSLSMPPPRNPPPSSRGRGSASTSRGRGQGSSSRGRGRGQAPAPRGRGRRSLFKQTPMKAPTATATVVTSDSVFFKGKYMQVGDIVSMEDVIGGTYYAQLRGFVTDQYCEKSAVVTWLLPTKASPPPEQCFDPATYIIGPEEELPRKLDFMEFVMHAPSDYFKATNTPFPPTEQNLRDHSGFIWTSLEPKERI